MVRHFSLKRKTAKNNDCGEWRITLHHDRRLPVIEVKFGPSGNSLPSNFSASNKDRSCEIQDDNFLPPASTRMKPIHDYYDGRLVASKCWQVAASLFQQWHLNNRIKTNLKHTKCVFKRIETCCCRWVTGNSIQDEAAVIVRWQVCGSPCRWWLRSPTGSITTPRGPSIASTLSWQTNPVSPVFNWKSRFRYQLPRYFQQETEQQANVQRPMKGLLWPSVFDTRTLHWH